MSISKLFSASALVLGAIVSTPALAEELPPSAEPVGTETKPLESANGSGEQNPAPENSQNDQKERLPTFEFGVAGALLQVPAYPGSAVKSDRQFAAPWFIYRSDKVQVKDGGVQLIAYESDNLVIDLGIGASLNADTSETPLRDGMEDLDFVFELGPRFTVPLSDKTSNGIRSRVNWVSALRFAVSTDFRRLDDRGLVFNTQLRYRADGFNNDKLSLSTALTARWIGNGLADYFYSVGDEFATPTRPAFEADAGYLGTTLSVGISYDFTPNISTFLSLGFTSLEGASVADSPLFETTSNTRVILAASWRIFKSKRLVRVRDE